MSKTKVYVASKVPYYPMWHKLRNEGLNIISTWIDEAEEDASPDLTDLAMRCIKEPAEADCTLLYAKEGDFLKFALAEVGSALSAGKPVFIVGNCESISTTMAKHPLVERFDFIEDAVARIKMIA